MAERRPLIAGLKQVEEVDPVLEKQFVHGEKALTGKLAPTQSDSPAVEGRETKSQSAVSRVPLTTRLRADYAAALKKASLERQLKGQFPNAMLEILEQALEPWLRSNGYIQ
jgi:hypothetical protein